MATLTPTLAVQADQIADLTQEQTQEQTHEQTHEQERPKQLTEEQLAGLNSAQMRTLAKELKVKNWWRLPMSTLRVEILAMYSQSAPNFEVVASSLDLSLEADLNQPAHTESQPESQPESLEEFRRLIEENLEVSEEDMAKLLSGWSITNSKCKTPNVAVVKRVTLYRFLNQRIKSLVSADEYLDYEIDDATFNQVITLASRYLARAPLTIKGASRFKYLLPNAAISVVIWTLDNLDKIQIAIDLADKAATQGYNSPKTTRLSRGLEPKPPRQAQ